MLVAFIDCVICFIGISMINGMLAMYLNQLGSSPTDVGLIFLIPAAFFMITIALAAMVTFLQYALLSGSLNGSLNGLYFRWLTSWTIQWWCLCLAMWPCYFSSPSLGLYPSCLSVQAEQSRHSRLVSWVWENHSWSSQRTVGFRWQPPGMVFTWVSRPNSSFQPFGPAVSLPETL